MPAPSTHTKYLIIDLLLLTHIRKTGRTGSQELLVALQLQGHDLSLRTVQRHLKDMKQAGLPIEHDGSCPLGWSWCKPATAIEMDMMATVDQIREHRRIIQLQTDHDNLRAALVGLVGADTPDELNQIKAMVPADYQHHAVTVTAIDVLIQTTGSAPCDTARG